MTIAWLIVWLIFGTPAVTFASLNAWAVVLIVCVVLDLTARKTSA